MYDCSGPMLVFVEQTLHPILNTHTGYIFAEYDVTYDEPRELFFSHVWEAQLYALKKSVWHDSRAHRDKLSEYTFESRLELNMGMQLVMDPRGKPERMTPSEYCSFDYAAVDGSQYENFGDLYMYPTSAARRAKDERYRARKREQKAAKLAEPGEVDFFGGE